MILEVQSSDVDQGIIVVGSTKLNYMFLQEPHPDVTSTVNDCNIDEIDDDSDGPPVERKYSQTLSLNQSNATKSLF